MVASKTLLDAALLFCLSGLQNMTLYLDNIIIKNQSKLGHLKSIKLVLTRLKVKPRKCIFFTTERIRLYGFILDLKLGKIFPDEDMIKGLMNRKIPASKRSPKAFGGDNIL